MNTDAILALIAELYTSLTQVTAERDALRAELAVKNTDQ